MLEVFGAVTGICYVAPTFYLHPIRQRFLHCPYWNDSIPCRKNSHSFTSALGSPCQHWAGEVRVWWVQETLLLHIVLQLGHSHIHITCILTLLTAW